MNVALNTEEKTNSQYRETSSRFSRLKSNVIWAKLSRWEFWPFSVFYFPITFYWAWLSIKTRSLFFFTASNPTIEFGGMLGESKDKIFQLIPDKYLPKTYLLQPNVDVDSFLDRMKVENLDFPLILKPDIGERGWMVEHIKDVDDLKCYLERIEVEFLVQEYVPYDIELGIFYYRYPDCDHGTISSIVMKEMLSVTGDGHRTVESLMKDDARAKMHIENIKSKSPQWLQLIPAYQEKVELNGIGNHSLGTTFLNGNHLINPKLIKVIDKLSLEIDGFYFGRYDLRCQSLEDLDNGENFKILELNGAGAEPAHIYHPGYSLIQAYKDIIHHLRVLADISILNRKRGIPFYTFREGIREVIKIQKYNQKKFT